MSSHRPPCTSRHLTRRAVRATGRAVRRGAVAAVRGVRRAAPVAARVAYVGGVAALVVTWASLVFSALTLSVCVPGGRTLRAKTLAHAGPIVSAWGERVAGLAVPSLPELRPAVTDEDEDEDA